MALLERAESLPQDLSARVLPPTVYEALFFFSVRWPGKSSQGNVGLFFFNQGLFLAQIQWQQLGLKICLRQMGPSD